MHLLTRFLSFDLIFHLQLRAAAHNVIFNTFYFFFNDFLICILNNLKLLYIYFS